MRTKFRIKKVARRRRIGRTRLSMLVDAVILVVILAVLATGTALAQETQPDHTFPECENIDESFLRDELNRVSKLVFEAERGSLDIGELVEKNWAELNLDADVNRAVNAAVRRMLQDEGYLSRLWSAWYPAKAEEFAERVSADAFDSPIFRRAIAKLSEALVQNLGIEIQRMMVVTASTAALCVEEFIGNTFSETMVDVLDERSEEWRTDISGPEFRTVIEDILTDSRKGTTTGAAILVGSQFTKLLAKRLAKGMVKKIVTRILGKAATAVVPVFGQILGGALIIWDLWDAREGALPEIRKAMKKENVKKDIRKQITMEVEARIAAASPALAEAASGRIYAQWEDFLQSFEHVLGLAERNPQFREIVDGITSSQVEKLSKLTAIGEEVLGTEWLNEIIDSGDFERLRALPDASFEILRDKADPDLVLSWASLSGNRIIQVVETKLYLHSSPSDFVDPKSVNHVLALKDPAVIEKLMDLEILEKTERKSLLRLPTNQTKWVLEELTTEEYTWLASYLEGLSALPQKELMVFAMRDRMLIAKLHSSQVLQSQFRSVVDLAAENQKFRTILSETASDQVGKLSALVAISENFLEPEVFRLMIDSGQFEEILALPRPAFAILRDQKDPNVVIEWGDLAGGRLEQVVKTGLYLLFDPPDIGSKERLERVLAINHRGAIERTLKLEQVSRDRVLELPSDLARELLTSLPNDHLAWVTRYLTELSLGEATLVADFILAEPNVLPILSLSHNLRFKLPGVLTLSERNPDFRAVLDETKATAIEKLANLTTIALEVLPETTLEAELKNGGFGSVFELPESAFDILREKGDVSTVIYWASLALGRIEDVAATKIYSLFSPTDFSSRDSLYKTLDLEDSEAIGILRQFSELQRVVLLSLSTEVARSALLSFSSEDLTWLAIFIAEIAPAEKDPTVSYLLERPELLPELRELGDLSSRFPRLILLSLDLPLFKNILDSTPAESIEKLAALVSAAGAAMTADELKAMIESRQFEACLSLPEEAFQILRGTGDPAVVLSWADLAGEDVVRVVESGLYVGEVGPDSFVGREELGKVLDLADPVAMQKAMTLGTEMREAILKLPAIEAKEILVSGLAEHTLEWLAAYMIELRPPEQQHLGRLVIEKPGLAEQLESSEISESHFTQVLETTLELPRLKEILDATGVDEMAKITKLIVIAVEKLSREIVVRMIESGQFETILALPQEAFQILQEKRDPALVIEWADLAGDSIVSVVESDLFRGAEPEEFQDKGELDSVLALGETAAMLAVMRLSQNDRSVILSLTPEKAGQLLTSLDYDPLTRLIQSYLAHLSRAERELLASHVLDQTDLLSELEHENIRESLLKAENKENSLGFLARRVENPVPWWPTVAMLTAVAAVALGDLPVAFYSHYFLTPSLVLLVVLTMIAVLAVVLVRRSRKQAHQPN